MRPLAAAACLLGLLPTGALAQTLPVELQRLRADPLGEGLVTIPGPELLPRWGLRSSVAWAGAAEPLRAAGSDDLLVVGQQTLDVAGALGLGVVDLWAVLPLHLDVTALAPGGQAEAGFAGVGDLALGAGARLLDAEQIVFGLAVHLNGTLPTGDEGRYGGFAGPTLSPAVVTEGRFPWLRLVTRTAVHLRPRAEGGGHVVQHGLELRIGVSVLPVAPWELRRLELSVELGGELGLPSGPDDEVAPERSPFELLGGLRIRPTPCLSVFGALGGGLNGGWGAARLRGLLGVQVSAGGEDGCREAGSRGSRSAPAR